MPSFLCFSPIFICLFFLAEYPRCDWCVWMWEKKCIKINITLDETTPLSNSKENKEQWIKNWCIGTRSRDLLKTKWDACGVACDAIKLTHRSNFINRFTWTIFFSKERSENELGKKIKISRSLATHYSENLHRWTWN